MESIMSEAGFPSDEHFPASILTPDDSDAWMHISPEEVDSAIKSRTDPRMSDSQSPHLDADGEEFDADVLSEAAKLGKIPEKIKDFLRYKSGPEGADVPLGDPDDVNREIDLDHDRVMAILRAAVGLSMDSDDDVSDAEADHDVFDRDVDFDSDEESKKPSSMSRVMHDMDAEIKGAQGKTESEAIDLYLNLVQSLLDSFAAEDGTPGPATSLLSSLGLSLPDSDKSSKKAAAAPSSSTAKR
eukprot:TRINITY_DN427_c0_g1::TRINITY_DN427_c0_g1_i1::g.2475::m.2475 TRINITY_DN427_c0_g1::TRINITY_DN427_c0_g1_i1::g.2475  ORF type:complete len:242 (+),score=55.70,sp/Q9LSM5/ECD_ARATH/23.60/4e-08,SGT1/PF07093.6/1.7e-14 TRINITY_DN427_c0_g1_i1:328-1053(+)